MPMKIELDFIKFFNCQVHIAFDSRVTNTCMLWSRCPKEVAW